jgi:hypothetical protein
MAQKDFASTRTGDELERVLRMIIYGWIEFSDNVVEHPRRDGKDCSSITALPRMTYSIG